MNQVIYELKIHFLKKTILICVLVALFMNCTYIFMAYQQGYGSDGHFMERTDDKKNMHKMYEDFHDKYDGFLTLEHYTEISNLYHNLLEITSKRQFSTEYDESTYSGYIFSDFYMITKYFYEPMTNNLKLEERRISYFYDFKPWDMLISYHFYEILVIVIIFLMLVPIRHLEKQSKMEVIIRTTAIPKIRLNYSRVIASIIMISIIYGLFVLSNILMYKYLYGLKGGFLPLYSIDTYFCTSTDMSINQFYIYITFWRGLSFLVFGMFVLSLSHVIHNIVNGYIINGVFLSIMIYTSRFRTYEYLNKYWISFISPYTGIRLEGFYIKSYDVDLLSVVVSRQQLFQMIIVVILCLLIGLYVLKDRIRENYSKSHWREKCIEMKFTNFGS